LITINVADLTKFDQHITLIALSSIS